VDTAKDIESALGWYKRNNNISPIDEDSLLKTEYFSKDGSIPVSRENELLMLMLTGNSDHTDWRESACISETSSAIFPSLDTTKYRINITVRTTTR
jgi:hypothetical protein